LGVGDGFGFAILDGALIIEFVRVEGVAASVGGFQKIGL